MFVSIGVLFLFVFCLITAYLNSILCHDVHHCIGKQHWNWQDPAICRVHSPMSSNIGGIYDPAGGSGSGGNGSGGGGHDQRLNASGMAAVAMAVEDNGGDSCSSSSIGRNSDDNELSGGGSDDEVQSSVRGGALNNLNALEEVLPIKRGISSFYTGKSKSFISLEEVETCSSVQEIAKPEDCFTRKRKNLLAHSMYSDINHNSLSRSSISGGVSKRLANSSRSTLDLGVTMTSSESSNNNVCSNPKSSSPCVFLPSLPPQGRRLPSNEQSSLSSSNEPSSGSRQSPWRSFSLCDLQHATGETPMVTGLVMDNNDKEGKI